MVLTAVASTMMSVAFLSTFANKPIHTNITKSEHLALENLRKDKDCIIVTADKGVALVVMDKTEYITKCEAHLQDNSVYQHLSKDTSPNIHKELIKILQDFKNNNFISEIEYTQLWPHGSNSPAAKCYGLPKTPQNNMSMNPIVSSCGGATCNTAKFITKIPQNYCGKTSSFVKDSTDFTKKIKPLSINPEETLVSTGPWKKEYQTKEIKPPSETITSPQNTQKQNLKIYNNRQRQQQTTPSSKRSTPHYY